MTEKIIQITSTTAHNVELRKDMVLVYALTDQGNIYEYLVGAWVKLNPLNDNFIGEFNEKKEFILSKTLRRKNGDRKTVSRH